MAEDFIECTRVELDLCVVLDTVYVLGANDVKQTFPGSLLFKNVTIVSQFPGAMQYQSLPGRITVDNSNILVGLVVVVAETIVVSANSVVSTMGNGIAPKLEMNGKTGGGGGSVGYGAPPYKTISFIQGDPFLGSFEDQQAHFTGGGYASDNNASIIMYGGGVVKFYSSSYMSQNGFLDSDGDTYVARLHYGQVTKQNITCEMTGSLRQLVHCSLMFRELHQGFTSFIPHLWRSRAVLSAEGPDDFFIALKKDTFFRFLFGEQERMPTSEVAVGGGGGGAVYLQGQSMQSDQIVSCAGGAATGGGGSGGYVFATFQTKPIARISTNGGVSETKGGPGYYILTVSDAYPKTHLVCENMLPSSLSFLPLNITVELFEASQCNQNFVTDPDHPSTFVLDVIMLTNSVIGSSYTNFGVASLSLQAKRASLTKSTQTSSLMMLSNQALLEVLKGSSIVCYDDIIIHSSTMNIYGEVYTSGPKVNSTVITMGGQILFLSGNVRAGRQIMLSKIINVIGTGSLHAFYGLNKCLDHVWDLSLCDKETNPDNYAKPSIFLDVESVHTATNTAVTAASIGICSLEASISGQISSAGLGCPIGPGGKDGYSGGSILLQGRSNMFLDTSVQARGVDHGNGGLITIAAMVFLCYGDVTLDVMAGFDDNGKYLGNGGDVIFTWIKEEEKRMNSTGSISADTQSEKYSARYFGEYYGNSSTKSFGKYSDGTCRLEVENSGIHPGKIVVSPPCKAGSSGIFCEPCDPGTHGNESICVLCEQGEYQPNSGSLTCLPCPAGTYSPRMGATTCENCPVGSYSDANSRACKRCPLSTFAKEEGSASCTYCPSNAISNMEGSDCTPCVPGTYSVGSHNVCHTCPAPLKNSHHYEPGCATNCDQGFFGKACLRPFAQITSAVGGPYILSIIMTSLLLLLLFPFFVKYVWVRNELYRLEGHHQQVANIVSAEHEEVYAYSARQKHRVYLLGSNEFHHPFMLPEYDSTNLNFLSQEKYTAIQRQIAYITCYRRWEYRFYQLLTVQFIPLAVHYKRRLMKHTCRDQLAYIRSIESTVVETSIKVGTSTCFTLGWIDFVSVQSSDEQCIAPPAQPLILHCGGNGSKLLPYHVCMNDPVVRSVQQYLGTNWQPFLAQLNTFLRVVPHFGVNHAQYQKPVLQYLTSISNAGGIGTGTHMPLNAVSVDIVLVRGENCLVPNVLEEHPEFQTYQVESNLRLALVISTKSDETSHRYLPPVQYHNLPNVHKRKPSLFVFSEKESSDIPSSPSQVVPPQYAVTSFSSTAKVFLDFTTKNMMNYGINNNSTNNKNDSNSTNNNESSNNNNDTTNDTNDSTNNNTNHDENDENEELFTIPALVNRNDTRMRVCAYVTLDSELGQSVTNRVSVPKPSVLAFILHSTCFRNVQRSDTLNFSLTSFLLFCLVSCYLVNTIMLDISLFQVIPLYAAVLQCILPPLLPLVLTTYIFSALSTRSLEVCKHAEITAVLSIGHSFVITLLTIYAHFIDDSITINSFTLAIGLFLTSVLIPPTQHIFTSHQYYKSDILQSRITYLYAKLVATNIDSLNDDVY